MKKFFPLLIVVLGFSGFLTAQLVWDKFRLNAQQIDQDKGKYQLFDTLYQGLTFTTHDSKKIEPKHLNTPLVMMNFWASWCLPCLKEFPSLVAFQKKYGDKLTVLGINGDEDEPNKHIDKISKEFKLTFPQIPDPKSEISDKFLITSYPYSILYYKGKVIHVSQKIQDFMDPALIIKVESALSSK